MKNPNNRHSEQEATIFLGKNKEYIFRVTKHDNYTWGHFLDWKGEDTEATKQENEEPIFTAISERNNNQQSISQTQPLHADEFLTQPHFTRTDGC